MGDLLYGFWNYVSWLDWWQAIIIIIVVLSAILIDKFARPIFKWIGRIIVRKKFESNTLQYRMFSGIVNESLNILIKNEFRRSCKENHLDQLTGLDFNNYVKDKHKRIIAILKKHIIDFYPSNSNLKISIDNILEYIKSKDSFYEDMVLAIFTEARQIKIDNDKKLVEIENEFINDMNNFVRNESKNVDCRNCLLIILSKKEILGSKKETIHILKNQMNFVEQKLIEIYSDLANFYSSKLTKVI